jgi:CheY-like chemotaxis protein
VHAVAVSPKLLVFGPVNEETGPLVERLTNDYEVVQPESFEEGVKALQSGSISGLVLLGQNASSAGLLLDAGGLLEHLPDGVVLLDADLKILWCNARFRLQTSQAGVGRPESRSEPKAEALRPPQFLRSDTPATAGCSSEGLQGCTFFQAFGTPEILGPDFCPFNTALGSGESARSTLRVGDRFYYEVQAKPVFQGDAHPGFLVVIVRDVSAEVLQRQKMSAIYQAGVDLGDLSTQEILELGVDQRIQLLKSKILHYTQDLLEFDTVEIRLLDKRTKRLEPLLASGMRPEAESRCLYAEPQGNGVTGFVAATRKSYLCEDTESDPLYLPGAPGARSSLTVPLILHDEVFGTFNVESPRPGAFTENDLQFLELFCREVAVALNTLELLVAEKMTTANESTDRILREVARPVDQILNDSAWILEKYIGMDPELCERLQHILKHTRDIKQVIQKVGDTIAPKAAVLPPRPERPKLKGKRILVADSDDSVRHAAHEILGKYGCDVETAHHGQEAFLMARTFHYDVVLADIRLPDMTGFECFRRLQEIDPHLCVILMTGFGYDPEHSIVKSRELGLRSVLYKPFRLDQLLNEVEKCVTSPADRAKEK